MVWQSSEKSQYAKKLHSCTGVTGIAFMAPCKMACLLGFNGASDDKNTVGGEVEGWSDSDLAMQ